MELVDGPTLADRIAQGPLPLDEALPIARQIAEALEAAHERGIIHRDLKPANIKLTAPAPSRCSTSAWRRRSIRSAARSARPMNSPAFANRRPYSGVILGTAAYMAPEQARGMAVDERADIWALGVVIYEMLAGHRPFEGKTISDTIAAVLRQDIHWAQLPHDTPDECAACSGAASSAIRRIACTMPPTHGWSSPTWRAIVTQGWTGRGHGARESPWLLVGVADGGDRVAGALAARGHGSRRRRHRAGAAGSSGSPSNHRRRS